MIDDDMPCRAVSRQRDISGSTSGPFRACLLFPGLRRFVGPTPRMAVGGAARRGVVVSGVRRMNEVNARRARLVL